MNKTYCFFCAVSLTIAAMATASVSTPDSQYWVYIGTNTSPPSKSKGIYMCRLDVEAGAISDPVLVAEVGSPGWQKIAGDGKFLYTVGTAQHHSIVAAYSINPATGALTKLNQENTNGRDSTHIDVDPNRTCAVVANYGSGSVSVMPINADGSIGKPSAVIQYHGSSINRDRQSEPHPHSCNFDPTGGWVLVPDLGLDKVHMYRFDASSRSLKEADPAAVGVTPGHGPRHMSFDPSGKIAYLVTEIVGTVVAFKWDAGAGRLQHLETVSTLPPDFHGYNKSAEVHITPDGRFLYASNRGPDDLAIFSVEPGTGKLKNIGFESTGGRGPRDFNIDPTGNFLFAENQDSDSIKVCRIDRASGKLTQVKMMSVPVPICVTFLAVGR